MVNCLSPSTLYEMAKNSRVLVISDLHAPYYHQDTIPFLKAIKSLFKPDAVILTGDEVEGHNISFHDTDPDLPFSASAELEKAIEYLQPIYELFPIADILESNHGSLVYRKGKHGGLPRSVFKDYREILEAPKRWNWHSDLTIRLSDGKECYFHHGKSANGVALALSEGMNVVQGHHHSKFEVIYVGTSKGFLWSVITGCMIDDKSLAFSYNKLQTKRPILGCTIILDGQPKLLPMVLNDKGRWNGKIV
jgi:hypothetical protein